MVAKVNFTKEHEAKFKALAIIFLFSGFLFDGAVGTKINIFQLIHDTSITILQNILTNLKKQIAKIEELSTWQMTDYQQRKLNSLKEQQDFVDLAIGFRLYQNYLEDVKKQKAEIMTKIKELEEDSQTPQDKLAGLKSLLRELDEQPEEQKEEIPPIVAVTAVDAANAAADNKVI